MNDAECRKMFIKWIKAASWHPCGLNYILGENTCKEFPDNIESIYQGYAAGIRKGMRIQKEKMNAK